MKINYILEYVSKEANKPYRSNLGYNINFVKAAVFEHLQRGDYNITILPILEDCDKDDPDNIEIIDINTEVKLDEVKTDD